MKCNSREKSAHIVWIGRTTMLWSWEIYNVSPLASYNVLFNSVLEADKLVKDEMYTERLSIR